MEKSRRRTNKTKSPASKSTSSNSSSTIPKSKPKKKLHEPTSRLWVGLDYTLEGVVVVLLVITLFNLAMRHLVDSKLKPSGQVIGTGHFGEALHVKCVGPEGGPLVILEGGLMQGHNVFVLVQESLQREGIASCSYDREGYGFSPRSGSKEKRLSVFTNNLHQALHSRMEKHDSFIVVGQEYGSLFSMSFANKIPSTQFAGAVLIAPDVPAIGSPEESSLLWTLKFQRLLTKFGLVRLQLMAGKHRLSPMLKQLPANDAQLSQIMLSRSNTYDTASNEIQMMRDETDSVPSNVVIILGQNDSYDEHKYPTATVIHADDTPSYMIPVLHPTTITNTITELIHKHSAAI